MKFFMSFFLNLKVFFIYIFKSKWRFKLPKKNKFILVDGRYNPFLKYIKKRYDSFT